MYAHKKRTKIKYTPIILDEAYNFLIVFKSRVPHQWAIAKNPENHIYVTPEELKFQNDFRIPKIYAYQRKLIIYAASWHYL